MAWQEGVFRLFISHPSASYKDVADLADWLVLCHSLIVG